MDNLLNLAIEAHGGLNAWNKFESLHANVSIGGVLWDQKQIPGLFKNARVELKLQCQHVLTHLVDLDERIVFIPNQVSLETESGETLDTRIEPRSAFIGQTADSKWEKLHAGYFCSYALWGYLTTPFVYTYPGFDVHEIEPWHEDGERWRVLQVSFPDEYAAHTRTQYSYFGEDGLLRRHLYTVDVLGGAQGRITDAVHGAGGLIFVQLWHQGSVTHRSLYSDGRLPLGPSAINPEQLIHVKGGRVMSEIPREMGLHEIKQAVKDFRHAAQLARDAGFDGVQIPEPERARQVGGSY